MNEDQPNIIQIEHMLNDSRLYKNVLIYGNGEEQFLLAKFLEQCDIKVAGLITRNKFLRWIFSKKTLKRFSIPEAKLFFKPKDTIVLISTPDYLLNKAYNSLKRFGYKNIYILSEWNKRTIPHKMSPRRRENFWLEFNVADHCNLNCQCCDHFSPIADKYFLPVVDFEKDIKRLSELMGGVIGQLKIQGGEPTLHPQLTDFMRLSRQYFPSSEIVMFTNGVVLLQKDKDQIWQAMKNYDIKMLLTTYPINLDYNALDDKAKEYSIQYQRFVEAGDRLSCEKSCISAEDKMSVHHPFNLAGYVPNHEFISCYQFNESITLRHGRIYTCPMAPYVGYFNKYFNQKLEVAENDSIDIYNAKSYEEIAEFCTQRTPFCRYCRVKERNCRRFTQSKKEITEWT